MTAHMTAEQFWALSYPPDPTTGCWEWSGPRTKAGYGNRHWHGRMRRVTHIAWFLTYGTWPAEWILHRCDNPPCVNPAHLFEGNAAANSADMAAKGRAARTNSYKTHCPRGHSYSVENTYTHRGSRSCIACKKQWKREWRLRRAA